MKYVMLVLMAGSLFGCANARIYSDNMQADGTYRIVTGGSITAGYDDLREEAESDAAQLCPSGYDQKGELKQKQGAFNRLTLIVRCKNS